MHCIDYANGVAADNSQFMYIKQHLGYFVSLHFYRTDPAATGAAPNPSDFNKRPLTCLSRPSSIKIDFLAPIERRSERHVISKAGDSPQF
jgi:hypothetical protein